MQRDTLVFLSGVVGSRHGLQEQLDYVVCPTCYEVLTRLDLEGYGRCPYCDHPFQLDGQLEDFLLRPVIQAWSQAVSDQPPAE